MPPMSQRIKSAEHFGGCPECGGTDGYRHEPVQRRHWMICADHRVKWEAKRLPDSWDREVLAQIRYDGGISDFWKMPEGLVETEPVRVIVREAEPRQTIANEVITSLDFLLNFSGNARITDFYQWTQSQSGGLRAREDRARRVVRQWLGVEMIQGVEESVATRSKIDMGKTSIDSTVNGIAFEHVRQALIRHRLGDWGLVGDKLWLENDLRAENHFCVSSIYTVDRNQSFWVTTDRRRLRTWVVKRIDPDNGKMVGNGFKKTAQASQKTQAIQEVIRRQQASSKSIAARILRGV